MIVTTPRSTEASSDKDDPKDSTTTTEESMEEAEETTRLRERLGWRKAAVCLRAKGIDNSDIGIGRGRQARGLSDNDGGVRGGQGIYDTY